MLSKKPEFEEVTARTRVTAVIMKTQHERGHFKGETVGAGDSGIEGGGTEERLSNSSNAGGSGIQGMRMRMILMCSVLGNSGPSP